MKTTKISDLSGFRFPTEEEIRAVSSYMKSYFGSAMRISRTMGIVLAFLAIFMLLGFFQRKTAAGKLGAAVFCIVCAAGAFYAWRTNALTAKSLRVFEEGLFQAIDGSVAGIESVSDNPGFRNVYFMSSRGERADGIFRVRAEKLEEGTPLLLVYVSETEYPQSGDFVRVFTPFMLTEEGIGKQLL